MAPTWPLACVVSVHMAGHGIIWDNTTCPCQTPMDFVLHGVYHGEELGIELIGAPWLHDINV